MRLGSLSLAALLLIFCFVTESSGYRLNVPRVLLPYHPTIPVKFTLEVSQPSGGCFNWRSTRPDVVEVTPIVENGRECSDRAEIRSTAKAAPVSELNAVIFAEDANTGTMLSCGVTVDQIARITIDTTTKILYVDASPVRIEIEAFNSEGDKFSTLSEIPLEWELSTEGSAERPLRIVPFEQSKYDAPAEIQQLEKNKKKGYLILLEGVMTGSSQLSAKFQDQQLSKIAPNSIDLVVVANLLLIPSYDLYVPLYSQVSFSVMIVRQQSTEVVTMPSTSYYLELDAGGVCALDKASSTVTADKKGSTEIHLLSHNVDVKGKAGVRPPSTAIHVVDAESLQWAVSGGNWLLETGRTYHLSVALFDQNGNSMYIADNTKFDSLVSSDLFDVLDNSRNATFFVVRAKKAGKTTLRSKFVSVFQESGVEHLLKRTVVGEQQLEVVDPLAIEPSAVAFPYLPGVRFEYPLQAVGGSGVYSWASAQPSIGAVDANSGVVLSGDSGSTTITLTDRRNTKHSVTAHVSVVEVLSIGFGSSRVEAEEGTELLLNVQLTGTGLDGKQHVITDCRNAPFTVEVADSTIFKHNSKKLTSLPPRDSGCAAISLKAVHSGDTKVTVRLDKYKASIDVSAYPALTASLTEDVLMSLGSDTVLEFTGGPRAWLLDPSQYYANVVSNQKFVSVSVQDQTAQITCTNTEGVAELTVSVGNGPSSSNELPARAEVRVKMCCARPTRIHLSLDRETTKQQLPACPASAKSMYVNRPTDVVVRGFGRCGERGDERPLHSLKGLQLEWSSDKKELLDVVAGNEIGVATASPRGLPGAVRVSVKCSKTTAGRLPTALAANLDIRLVDTASVAPSKLVLWNDASTKGKIVLSGGSGHFVVQTDGGAPFSAFVKDNVVTVSPSGLGSSVVRVLDVCIDGAEAVVPVRVTDIHQIVVNAPRFMEVGSSAPVSVEVQDDAGEPFSTDLVSQMHVKLQASGEHVALNGERVRGSSVGTSSLSASAKAANGRVLTSRPHSIQVFSPIRLEPRLVTLIPESTFQLEVIGGPQPTPPLHFSLNSTKVASVEENALIGSKDLGWTSVTGTVNVADGHTTKDTVVVRVVSLRGVRISASTRRAERGGRVWLRVEGVSDDETPFAFGGAHYPFTVSWSVSQPDVLRAVQPLGVEYPDMNKYVMVVDALTAGTSRVSVVVKLHDKAFKHFVGSSREFTAYLDVKVDESLQLHSPDVTPQGIRIAPGSSLQLTTTWPESSTVFTVPSAFSSLLSVTGGGELRARSAVGNAAVLISRAGASNDSTLVPVVVSPVFSVDVVSASPLMTVDDNKLVHLPVGYAITLNVVFRDSRGRVIHTAPNRLRYRPHRFDLTKIEAADANRTLTVTMKTAGETVLKIWDSSDEGVHVAFVRLSAVDGLWSAVARRLVVGDVVCMRSPLAGPVEWAATDSRVKLVGGGGAVLAVASGNTQVDAKVDGQVLHTQLSLSSPSVLLLVGGSKWVDNAEEARHVFPVRIAFGEKEANVHGNAIGCAAVEPSVFEHLRAPFTCRVAFVGSNLSAAAFLHAAPVFDREAGWSCVVSRQRANAAAPSMSEVPDKVTLTAAWTHDSNPMHSAVTVLFYPAFEVVQQEVSLSNYQTQQQTLSVRVPSALSHYVKAYGCEKDIVSVAHSTNTDGIKTFSVKLNVKSATVWQDSSACDVRVESSLTGQIVKVPVKVRLVGEATKHVYNALDSAGAVEFVLIFLQHYAWLLPSLMWACLAAMCLIGAYMFLRRPDSKAGYSAMNTTGVFASDTSSLDASTARSMDSSMGSWTRSPPKFSSTPADAGMHSPFVGSRGDPALWSRDIGSPLRRRHL